MDTILLAWNPDRFRWGDLQDELAEIRRSGQVADRWSVGNRTTRESGARFFLISLGVEPRGLGIIPAPVRSRSDFTRAAVTSGIDSPHERRLLYNHLL